MTKIASAFDDIHDAERELADALRTIAERHASDVDVYHVAHLLASRCSHQLELLAPHAERYGAYAPTDADTGRTGSEGTRRLASPLPVQDEAPGVVLLLDLQLLYRVAHGAELAWVVLLQVAQAARDERLVSAAREGREEAERRWKWLRTKIKESCPQVLLAS
jgi:hypothetical protein